MSFRCRRSARVASRVFAVFLESLRRIKQRNRGEKVQKCRVKGYFRIIIPRARFTLRLETMTTTPISSVSLSLSRLDPRKKELYHLVASYCTLSLSLFAYVLFLDAYNSTILTEHSSPNVTTLSVPLLSHPPSPGSPRTFTLILLLKFVSLSRAEEKYQGPIGDSVLGPPFQPFATTIELPRPILSLRLHILP